MNELNKGMKATSVSTFDFSTLYTKLPHNKLLIVLNSLIDFCFDEAHWVNNIKDNVICLNKQQIKDAVAYLLLNCYFTVGPEIFVRLLVFLWGLIQLLFLPTYSYISMKVSG